MKNLRYFIALMVFIPFVSCNAQQKKEIKASNSDKIEAYYFHFTARCITCKTVEAEAQKDIESLYGSKVPFVAINLDDESGKDLAEKLQVSGQTLLIRKGDTKINITNEGFMYARSNPEKFKSIIKEKIDGLMNL